MFGRTKSFIGRRASRLRQTAEHVVNVDDIKTTGRSIRDMASALARQGRKRGREETFNHAYRRLNLDEPALGSAHRYHSARFWIFSSFASLALGFFIFACWRLDLLWAASSLGAVLLLGSLAFQASFRLFQIERRELVDVSAWVHTPGSWIPAPFMPQPRHRSTELVAHRRSRGEG